VLLAGFWVIVDVVHPHLNFHGTATLTLAPRGSKKKYRKRETGVVELPINQFQIKRTHGACAIYHLRLSSLNCGCGCGLGVGGFGKEERGEKRKERKGERRDRKEGGKGKSKIQIPKEKENSNSNYKKNNLFN
jgi:hypothetical protein